MNKLYIIYKLEIQDGENRYSVFSTKTIGLNYTSEEVKLQAINDIGENLAKEWLGTPDDYTSDSEWYTFDSGLRAVRYYAFTEISNEICFKEIERII